MSLMPTYMVNVLSAWQRLITLYVLVLLQSIGMSKLSVLTYKQGFPEILSGVVSNPFTRKYIPPFDEFEVDQCSLPKETSTVFSAVPCPSIYVVMVGAGTLCTASSEECITEGDVLFVPTNTEITAASTSGMNLYRAGVNSQFFEPSEFAASK